MESFAYFLIIYNFDYPIHKKITGKRVFSNIIFEKITFFTALNCQNVDDGKNMVCYNKDDWEEGFYETIKT